MRGLGYTPRKPSEVPAQELARLDTLYAAASALGMIDNLLGADVQTRHLRMALAVGEEKRVVRALAIDIVYPRRVRRPRNLEQGARRWRATSSSRRAASATRRSSPSASSPSVAPRSSAATTARTALAFEEAEQLLAPLVGVEWERITSRFFRCYSRIAMGDFAAATRDAEATLVDAERRNDLYARGLFGTSPACGAASSATTPTAPRGGWPSGREGWPDEPFLMIHFLEMTSGAAHRSLSRRRRRRRSSGSTPGCRASARSVLSKMPWVMAEYRRYLRRRRHHARQHRRSARRWLMPLRKLDTPLTRAYLAAYDGIFALRAGKRDDGQRLLIEAHPPVRRRRHAAAVDGDQVPARRGVSAAAEGERMTAEAIAWMRDAGVVAPSAMIDLLLPPV